MLIRFAEDLRLDAVAGILNDQTRVQRNLKQMTEWTNSPEIKWNRDGRKVQRFFMKSFRC